jgi:hypothetical protein
MLFNSPEFGIFLVVVALLYAAARGFRDELGHFTSSGAESLARSVRPALVSALEAEGVVFPRAKTSRW